MVHSSYFCATSVTVGVPFSGSVEDRLALASKRCVFDPRSSSNFVMRFTCTGKMLAYYLCSLIGHNNPIVSQRTCSLAGHERLNNPIVSQRACHWEDHPSSSSS